MKCPLETRGSDDLLLDFLAGKLDTGTRAAFEAHREICPACREFCDSQQSVWQALDAWDPAPVSMDFDRRLYQRIEQQVTWWQRIAQSLHPLFRHAVPLGAAAGVVLVAGLLLNRPTTQPPSHVQQSAQVEALQPEQVANALDDMEMVREFNDLVRADDTGAKL